ncbi:MAG TPA: membrane protein insertase YidC [Mycobacteriales bacterium]|nr:membrane protein insertase YidC [Mycobacteriales bacterium]
MLDALASPVGHLLRVIHEGVSQVLSPGSGPAWGLSIVLLTVCVRLALFPLFVKQIKSQRRMQQLSPLIKELQKKHKGDRETMNTELMKLYKEHGTNPVSGCLPLLLQMPVFFALFSVIRQFKPNNEPHYGLSSSLLEEGGRAKIFGAPIAAVFNSSESFLDSLGANASTVRVVAAVMVVLMGASTFWTQKQMMARAGTIDPQQAQIQKFMLYVLPLSFAVSGFFFPIGLLLYWLTTNLWSMGQQAWVIKRMPPAPNGAPVGPAAKKDSAKNSAAATPSPGKDAAAPTTGTSTATPQPRPQGARKNSGNRKRKNGRRGGRR